MPPWFKKSSCLSAFVARFEKSYSFFTELVANLAGEKIEISFTVYTQWGLVMGKLACFPIYFFDLYSFRAVLMDGVYNSGEVEVLVFHLSYVTGLEHGNYLVDV